MAKGGCLLLWSLREIRMFTGLVTHIGKIVRRSPYGDGERLSIACSLENYEIGESIAVNGVCLTVEAFESQQYQTLASVETLRRSNLGALRIGDEVHLERALRLGDRFGGHIVSGHVDTTATIANIRKLSSGCQVSFELSEMYTKYIVEKGSICIDGLSLTVNRVEKNSFDVMLIPHTQSVVASGFLSIGRRVNIEVDMLAKYVEKLLSCNASGGGCIQPAPRALSIQDLRENGF